MGVKLGFPQRLTVFEDGLLRMVPHGTKPHSVEEVGTTEE
jgi:hypothetical protein